MRGSVAGTLQTRGFLIGWRIGDLVRSLDCGITVSLLQLWIRMVFFLKKKTKPDKRLVR